MNIKMEEQHKPTSMEKSSYSKLVKYRHSLRGLKRCKSCNAINGQRAQICSNVNCELRKKVLAARRPFDPVQLENYTGAHSFSIRSKERDVQPRSFVQITEVALALEDNTEIVSTKAICFVDTCKYDATDAAGIACKHIKACVGGLNNSICKAEVYKIAREVLWNLNIEDEQKQRLWNIYKENEQQVPAVQRLNASTFAVKCVQSKLFPAGRLHVTALSNGMSSKKGTHSCACKKLKIIVEPDNSVVMQEEICDHLLLVLAAILSKQNGKSAYGNFTNALKTFWMPAALETPISSDAFFDMSINIGGNFSDSSTKVADDDIFIFGNEFLANDNIFDLSYIHLTPNDMTAAEATSLANNTVAAASGDLLHPGDPNLVSSCGIIEEEDHDMHFHDVMSAATNINDACASSNDICTVNTTHLELSDCNIELMDQFQLTDQIDLCSEPTELFDGNSISILSPPLTIEQHNQLTIKSECCYNNNSNNDNIKTEQCIPILDTTVTALATRTAHVTAAATIVRPILTNTTNNSISAGNSLLKTNQQLVSHLQTQQQSPTIAPEPPPIEMPTIAVVKKCPVKASEIVTEVRTRKSPYIPAKRALIVNNAMPNNRECLGRNIKPEEQGAEDDFNGTVLIDATAEPSLAYSAWLEYVIELINSSIDIVDKTDVAHSFHVHEEIFAHFSKSFSLGVKRRLPNTTTVVKTGKYKGLIKYVWYFTTASTVRRIFSTKNISIELERSFECANDGAFVPYVRKSHEANGVNNDTKHRRIYPKLSLYIAHIWFDCGNGNHKNGMKLEWLPNVFPQSHFGILNIEFSLGIREPRNL